MNSNFRTALLFCINLCWNAGTAIAARALHSLGLLPNLTTWSTSRMFCASLPGQQAQGKSRSELIELIMSNHAAVARRADEFSYPNPAKRSCSSVVERSRDYGEATTSDFPNDCSSLEAPGTISSNVTIDALISNAERFELPSLDCMVVDPTETHALLERRSFSTDLSIESRDDEAQQYTQTSC